MRLTIINQYYAPDLAATAHLAASLAEHRAARGDEVTVLASTGGYVPDGAVAAAARSGNPRVIRVWTPRLGKGSLVRRGIDYGTFYGLAAVRMMALARQDLIISLTTPPAIGWTGALHRMIHSETKLVLWNMDCYPELGEVTGGLRPDGLFSRALRGVNRRLFRRLDHVVCLDLAMVDRLKGTYLPEGLATTVIPNWEPASMFPAGAEPEEWEKASELELGGRFVVLYLGNMGVGYEFETVVEAAEAMRAEPVVFLFVGGGAHWEYLEREREARGLSNIVLHGYVPKEEVPAVEALADCALITLSNECAGMASPSKLHGNLAMGLPVAFVGPRRSNVDEAIRRFNCGVSLRPGESEALAAYIRSLMADRAALAEAARKARRAFDEAYCDQRTLPMFDEVIEAVCGDGAMAGFEGEAERSKP